MTNRGQLRKEVRKRGRCNHCGRIMGNVAEPRAIIEEDFDPELTDSDNPVQTERTVVLHWTVDHIIPIGLGGAELDIDNLQLLCPECNKVKTHYDHIAIEMLRMGLDLDLCVEYLRRREAQSQ